MKYFDASYLVRLYFEDSGWEKVRALAATDHVGCCAHGRAEVVAAFHRKFREGVVDSSGLTTVINNFLAHSRQNSYAWLPISEATLAGVIKVFESLPSSTVLRAADAIHLACAAENGFSEIHSNDSRFLSAAPFFGLKAVNVI